MIGLDVFELGLPPLRGQTLVQYAGSLTGHDFRVIAQVAPAVLFDLVDNNRYEAWLALCRLTPLALRPELKSLEAYLVSWYIHLELLHSDVGISDQVRAFHRRLPRMHSALVEIVVQ